MISSAKEKEILALQENVSKLSACSRLIPLEHFLERPEYTTGALYDVRATEQVVTSTETRIKEVDVKSINFGLEEYNESLSKQRAETVASYLEQAHGIDASRIVMHSHGSDNPIASNDTDEGRAANRRVEVAVGGI